ncbi:MAG: DUF7309 domain-containing protein [Kiritimatiellia bacterium]
MPVDLWKDLFRLADRLYRLAPWNWMADSAIFALRFRPDAPEPRLMAVLSQPGKFPVLSLLPGWRSAYLILQRGGDAPFIDPANIPQLNVLFGVPQLLAPLDRAAMEAAGVPVPENGAPLFRSLRDGPAPWFFTLEEAQLFREALNQLLGVALRSEEDPNLLLPGPDQGLFARTRIDANSWTDDRVVPPAPPPPTPQPKLDPAKAAQARAVTGRIIASVQADVRPTPISLEAPDSRPIPAQQLLVVEPASNRVLINALVVPSNGIVEMWHVLPSILLDGFLKLNSLPQEIQVANPRLQHILRGVIDQLPFKLTRVDRVEAVDALAKAACDDLIRRIQPRPAPS